MLEGNVNEIMKILMIRECDGEKSERVIIMVGQAGSYHLNEVRNGVLAWEGTLRQIPTTCYVVVDKSS